MDFEYVVRNRSTASELYRLGGLSILAIFFIPILTLYGYLYESFVNIIQGEDAPPDWEYINLTVSGLIPLGYLFAGGLVGTIAYLPGLIFESGILLGLALLYGFVFSYAYPALIASYRVDMSPVSMVLSKNYAIGMGIAAIVYFGVSILLGIFIAVIWFVVGGSGLLFLGGLASLGEPVVLLIALVIALVVGSIIIVPLYGLSIMATHIGIVPIGEKMEDELSNNNRIRG